MIKNELEALQLNDPHKDSIFSIRGDLDGELAEGFTERAQFIGMLIDEEEFLLPISVVSEIVMLKPITYVPESPRYIEGVFNLRGQILPAINIRKMMGLERGRTTPASRLIIAKHQELMVGILVDSITYVCALLPSEIEQRSLSGKSGAELITQISKIGTKITGILDLDRILSIASGNDNTENSSSSFA